MRFRTDPAGQRKTSISNPFTTNACLSRLSNPRRFCAWLYSLRLFLILLCIPYLPVEPAAASSVRQVSVGEMLKGSEFVFEGVVVATEAYGASGRIYTAVTFEILRSIQGAHSGRNIVLTFLGGTVGDLSFRISDMRMPVIGERGIYFVESLQRRQVHPLYGWHQGHFLIARGPDGREVVTTVDGFPITQVDSPVAPQSTLPSEGPALGIRASRSKDAQGMTPDQFVERLTAIRRVIR